MVMRKNQPLVSRSNFWGEMYARTAPWFRGQTLLVPGHGGGGGVRTVLLLDGGLQGRLAATCSVSFPPVPVTHSWASYTPCWAWAGTRVSPELPVWNLRLSSQQRAVYILCS